MPMPWPTIPRAQLAQSLKLFADRSGVVVYGDPGVGKTHLAADLQRALTEEDPDRYVWFTVAGSHRDPAQSFSSIDGLLPDTQDPDERSPRQIARSLRTHLNSQADGRRVAIIVDDAHRLDAASAEVLTQMCRAGEIHLLVTSRSGREVADHVVNMWRDEVLGRIDIPPFTPDEVGEVVRAALGGPVDSGLIRELFSASEGSPMYVRELLRAGVADGSVVQRHGIWLRGEQPRISARLIDVVAAELSHLSGPERDAVELIALAEPVSAALTRPHITPKTLERLVEYGVVRVEHVPGQGQPVDPALRLSHPIYSECVRGMISPAASHEWHAALYPDTPSAAHHTAKGFLRWTAWTLECGLKVGAADLVTAARAASSLGQTDFAIRAATLALESSADAPTAIDALSIRARELYYRELPHEALRDVDAALRLLETGPSPVDEVEGESILAIHELRGDIQQFGLDDADAALETIERFFAALLASPLLTSSDRAAHTRRYEMAKMTSRSGAGDFVTPLKLADQLVSELNGELDAVPSVMIALTWAGRTAEAKALAAHYETVTIPDHAVRAGTYLRFGTFLMHIVTGRLSEARACAPDPFSVVESKHFDSAGAYACSGRLLAAEGRWREADDRFQIARQVSDVQDPFGLRVWSMASESVSAAQLGDDDRARELLLRIERTPWRTSRSLEADTRSQIIRTLVMLRDPGAADAAVDFTAWAAAHDYFLVELWGHDLIAVADPLMARRGGTAERLVELAARVDAPITGPLIAHARAVMDSDPTLEAAAAAQLNRLGHWVPRRSALPPTLSRREGEIVALVAAGLSNRAIAERLHLSSRTVEAHISRVFTKLGINRRGQLTDVLRKHSA